MDWSTEIALMFAAIILILYIIVTWRHDYFKKRDLPFTKPLPIIGNMGRLILRKFSMGENVIDIYNQFKGHGIAGFFEFLTPVIMIRDPEIIRKISVKDFDHFTDHRTGIREDVDPLFGRNMFTLQGQRWREMRNTLSPAFTSSKMKAMFLLIEEIGVQLADYMEKMCKGTKDGLVTMEMKDLFTRYTNDVIATAAFGIHCDSLEEPNNEFYRIGKEVANFGGIKSVKFLGFLLSIKLMKLLNITVISKSDGDFFRSLVHSTIETRERENIIRPDMIHLLMQAKKGTLKNNATDEGSEGMPEENRKKMELADDDITANALLFFLAGFDTSSTLLCFMSQLVAMHPDVQRRVQREMDHILEEDGGKLTYDGVQKMKYLDMVMSESMRLYPPAAFTDRLCVKPYVIEETESSPRVFLNAGEGVMLPIIALHHDPELFPNPEKFDPERFSEENKHNIKPFTYLPFGVGPRNCVGMRFALMEAKIAFACLLTRFDLEVVSKTSIPIVMLRSSISMGAEGGFWLGIRPRSKATA